VNSFSFQINTILTFANSLFGNTRWDWLWLIVRLYIGYTWLSSGIGKLNNQTWLSGDALKGFRERTVLIPDAPAKPANAVGRYRDLSSSCSPAVIISGSQNSY